MQLIIQPWHIATRGRFDGEYGIATRGYVVCPALVARIPTQADVIDARLFGVVTPEELEAVLREFGWVGELDLDRFGLDAAWQVTSRLYGEVTGLDMLEAVIDASDPLVGLVTCLEAVSAGVSADGTVGVVVDGEAGSTLTMTTVTGTLEEKPGEGACQVDKDVEPC